MAEISRVLSGYQFASPVARIERVVGGNINTTYKITLEGGEKYILQRINTSVFKDPEGLMDNIITVTCALRREKNKDHSLDKMQVLNIKFSREGKPLVRADGAFYRMYDYMADSLTYRSPSDLGLIRSAGAAFGRFLRLLAQGEPLELKETLKDFHNTPLRFSMLAESYQKAPESRKNKAKRVYGYLLKKGDYVRRVSAAAARLPLRAVHNDTKCDNVVFDRHTGEAVGVVDLDTVMQGLVMYDFGDGARSICSTCREDEKDASLVNFDRDRFRAFTAGYMGETAAVLTDAEKALMHHGVMMMTLELSARFLTDYLDGDKYFLTEYSDHNLVRASCQAALSADVERNASFIKKTLENAYKRRF